MSKAIAEVFADAKDAPTSFEPEEWIEGFQFARAAIAERLANCLVRMDASFDKAQFLKLCDIGDDEGCPTPTSSSCGVGLKDNTQ